MPSLIRRLWPMHRDIVPNWRPRHRGRPALVARRPVEWKGADLDWDVKAELARADEREPEETVAEAAEREADELVRHLAELDAAAEESVTAELAAELDPVLGPLYANVDATVWTVLLALLDGHAAEADRVLTRAYAAATPTGEYPVVRELVAVA